MSLILHSTNACINIVNHTVATNQLARAKDSCDKRRQCASMRENAYYDFVRAFFVRVIIIKSALLETGHVSRSQIV